MAGWLVGWLAGLVGWSGWLGWLTGWCCLVGWLVGWLSGWLVVTCSQHMTAQSSRCNPARQGVLTFSTTIQPPYSLLKMGHPLAANEWQRAASLDSAHNSTCDFKSYKVPELQPSSRDACAARARLVRCSPSGGRGAPAAAVLRWGSWRVETSTWKSSEPACRRSTT